MTEGGRGAGSDGGKQGGMGEEKERLKSEHLSAVHGEVHYRFSRLTLHPP